MVKLRFLGKTRQHYNYSGERIHKSQVVELEDNQASDLLECFPKDFMLVGSPPESWSQLLGRVPKSRILRVALPDGIGDAHWTLLKLESLKRYMGATEIHVSTQNTPKHDAGDLLKLVPFIDTCKAQRGFSLTSASKTGWAFEKDLVYLWAFRGITRNNNSIYDWLPELDVNFEYEIDIPKKDEEHATKLLDITGSNPILFHASWRLLSGSNTGQLWKSKATHQLASYIHQKTQKKIVLVGKEFERKHTKKFLEEHSTEPSIYTDLVGKTTLPQLLALTKQSQFVFGYQCGVTFLSTHFKIPSALLWGVKKVTNSSGAYKWERKFMTSFTPKEALDKWYFPCVLGEDSPETVWNRVKHLF